MGQVLTFTQLEQLWTQNGGDPTWAPVAAGVALAESGGSTTAANRSDPAGGSFGLWQINGVHAPGGVANAGWVNDMYDPNANARAAIAVSSNGTNWHPWEGDPVGNAQIQQDRPLSVSAIQSILSSSGRTGGGLTGANAGALSATQLGTIQPGACDSARYFINAASFHFINECQLKALYGGALMVVGGLGLLVAGALLAAAFAEKSPVVRAVTEAVPVARVLRGARAGTGGSRAVGNQLSSGDREELSQRREEDQRARASQQQRAQWRREGFASDREPSGEPAGPTPSQRATRSRQAAEERRRATARAARARRAGRAA